MSEAVESDDDNSFDYGDGDEDGDDGDEDGEGDNVTTPGEETISDDSFAFDPKSQPFINQFNKANKLLCVRPSYQVALDEMMTRFKGRSADTYRMKSKPIKEGFKFFAVACSQSTFVYHMVSYGRVKTNVGIIKTVKALINVLPQRDKHKYLLSADNYFTYDKAIDYCVANGVHVVGTAKAKRGWPPAALSSINENRFNFLHYLKSNSGKFLIYRWVG